MKLMTPIVELLDKVDAMLRERLKQERYETLATRNALKEVRELIQKAITVLLDAH